MDNKTKQKLVDRVIEKIKDDVLDGDVTAIDELLKFVPTQYLIGFLPEEEWVNFIPKNLKL